MTRCLEAGPPLPRSPLAAPDLTGRPGRSSLSGPARSLPLGRRLGALFIALCFLAIAATARAGCEPYPVGPDSPTGIVGCEVTGTGTASMWGGPGIARNDCVWPWDACQPIAITALDTGRTITVTPSMYCDCFTGTSDERIVDLDPASVAALGLDASRGLWPVTVAPVYEGVLPDTAVPR